MLGRFARAARPLARVERRFASSAATLAEILRDERDGEQENVEKPPELDDLLARLGARGATVAAAPGKGRVAIDLGNSTVVNFDCRDVGDLSDVEPAQTGGGYEPIEVEVVVGPAAGDRLVFECVAGEAVHVDAVSYFRAGDDDDDGSVYDGPKFDELDDRVQTAFYAYLEDAGVDAELCATVTAYAAHKEAVEYAGWLENVAALVGEAAAP